MKKISVVLPTYNGEQYLAQSIQSVLDQTYQNLELIIVDDCSTDGTPAIIRRFAERDSRIRVIHNRENQKLPRSLNIGFRQAAGEYFTWTSDDNRYKPKALECMFERLEAETGAGLVYCDMDFIDREGNRTGSLLSDAGDVYHINCIGACFLYRREVAERVGEYDPSMFLVEDYDYWLRIARQFPIIHIPGCFYEYRRHEASLSERKAVSVRRQLNKLRMRELDFLLLKIGPRDKISMFAEMWPTDGGQDGYLKKKFFGNESLPPELQWTERERRMDNSKRIILFGAGVFGRKALEYFGVDRVAYFVDNNPKLIGKHIEGIEIISFNALQKIHERYQIVISVDAGRVPELALQLDESGITEYTTYIELVCYLKKPSANGVKWLEVCEKAKQWILQNSVAEQGIINSSGLPVSYPEVSGYYIPTLMRWGFRDLALTYAKWLLSIQHSSGAWYDTEGKEPYVFDTAQILKGLLAVRDRLPGADEAIRKGADWILSNIQESGQLKTPSQKAWGEEGVCSELIHLYCLSPLMEAAEVLKEPKYRAAAKRVADYYTGYHMAEIQEFGFLAHFYAYVMEAFCDIGREEVIAEPMKRLAEMLDEKGYVPAYHDVNWVCSTAMFQFAVVWFKLGDLEHGSKALEYGAKLQNDSGGWYGSYPTSEHPKVFDRKEYPEYFASSEISWAVKYFLDAVYEKQKLEFERQASVFSETIACDDGRYQTIVSEIIARKAKKVCDVGCGKGRYLKNLLVDVPQAEYCAVDISKNVMRVFGGPIEKKTGALTCIPYGDESFDLVYASEALEHSIFAENAVKELLRVTKAGGEVIVIDKNQSAMGRLEIDEWEQWFTDEFFEKIAAENNCRLRIIKNLSYDGGQADGLFNAFILEKYVKFGAVVFGAGKVGEAALLMLDHQVDFFIDNKIYKEKSSLENTPVFSLEDAKMRLKEKKVILGTVNPAIEEEMRKLLSETDAGEAVSVSEFVNPLLLRRFGQCDQYDYSEILSEIWQSGRRYECLYHMVEWNKYTSKKLVNPIDEIFQKYQFQNSKLVDVACGYGFWSLFFSKRHVDVWGIDNDAERLDVLCRVAKKHPNIAAAVADIRDMKCIPDHSQDVAFCANTIHMVPNWRKVLSEMNRIVRAKGFVVLVVTHPDNIFIRKTYQDSPFMQWDATCEKVIEAMSSGAELVESVRVHSDESLKFSNEPSHSVLVFSRK